MGIRFFGKSFRFKYELTVIGGNTLEEVPGSCVSKPNGLSVLSSVFAVLLLIAALIVSFVPLRNCLPGYMSSEARKQAVVDALRAGSPDLLLRRQCLYIMNIRDIIKGEVRLNPVHSVDPLAVQCPGDCWMKKPFAMSMKSGRNVICRIINGVM